MAVLEVPVQNSLESRVLNVLDSKRGLEELKLTGQYVGEVYGTLYRGNSTGVKQFSYIATTKGETDLSFNTSAGDVQIKINRENAIGTITNGKKFEIIENPEAFARKIVEKIGANISSAKVV